MGASYNSSKPTLDYRQLLDARRIEEAFSNDEIQIMINPDFFDDPNISDSFAKNVLRIVYSNLYTDNEIINSFLILSYDDPDDEYKKIPIPNLIRALNHIGYSGLAKIINEYMRSLKSNEKSNLIELLKKSFSDIASKRSVPSFEKKILMEIFSSSPNDDYNLFSWIEPLKMTNKRSVISQILGGAANKEYIVKREEFFKKIGGPSGLSESERLDYLNGISFYIGLQREFINPPFMKDTAFVHFMKNKPWFNVRFLGNKYAFWLVTGNMIESEEERRAYLDNFGKK